ncbi:hypothetical protein MTR_1g030250 [Medicago truncatula]|uniref:Uncharacterized protein n=1 Tax=Medicago truncatula TaxID=3880 RepID=G7I8E9_MEDTR|nr:hypothetical protein MTR_1g030250 [Medicago truncatula]
MVRPTTPFVPRSKDGSSRYLGFMLGLCLDQFFDHGSLTQSFSSYFVTLIPNADSPLQLGDFNLLSLPKSLYKLVAKVFVGRLARVMDKIILFKNRNGSLL